MNELIKELRAWLSIRPEINHRAHLRKEFEEILSRHKAKDKAVEPLERLAERKGASMAYAVDSSGTLYSEAAARKFLEGLDDVREGKK